MTALAALYLVAALGYGLARWLRLPVVPLLIAGGVIMAAVGGPISGEFLESALELGLTFLVFAAGIELNPQRIKIHRSAVIWVGIVQFVAVGFCGFLLASFFQFSTVSSLYLGFALGTSSTLVVIRHLKQRQQAFEPFGRLVIGVLLLQDLVMMILIIVMSRLPDGLADILRGLGAAVVCGGLAFLCQKKLMPRLIVQANPGPESMLLISLGILFAFVGLVRFFGLPAFVGAFMAGFALSAFPVNGLVRGVLNSLNDFFIAMFFTALGGMVAIPDLATLGISLVFALAVVLVTPPLVAVITEWKGLTSRAALESGLLLAQNSEFSLVLGLTGLHLGHINENTLSIIVMFTVFTMTLTPFIATERVTQRLMHWHPLRRRLSTHSTIRDHVLMLGFGSGGMWVLKPLRQDHYEVLVVDDDPVVIEQLQKMNIPCLRGDGSDEKILQRAGAREARLILASMRRVRDTERVLRFAPKVKTCVRVFEEEEGRWIASLGGIPILNSEAALETFLTWFHKSGLDQEPSPPDAG